MGETVQYLAFFVFSIITLGAGLGVVSTNNLFHAALYLLASLFGVAGLFVLLVAPFLAAIQVLVYMGAIGILIIFSIMLTRSMMQIEHPFNAQSIAAGFTALALFIFLTLTLTPAVDELGVLEEMNIDFADEDNPAPVEYETVEAMGQMIADRDGFVLPFELASLLLTGAMIGAIVVSREDEA